MFVEHSAFLGSAAPVRGFLAAVEGAIAELGFVKRGEMTASSRWPHTGDLVGSEQPELEVKHVTPERGAWVCLGVAPPMARALGARLAARTSKPIQVFTATVRCKREEDSPSERPQEWRPTRRAQSAQHQN